MSTCLSSRFASLFLLFLFLATALGCDSASTPLGGADAGSDSGGGSDTQLDTAFNPPDLPADKADAGSDAPQDLPPDLPPVDAPTTLGTGRVCAGDFDCESGFFCLDEADDWPTSGYCTSTCTLDDDCGADAFCSAPLPGGGQVCMLRCMAASTCASAAHICSQRLGGVIDLGQPGCVPGKATSVDGSPCLNLGDCRGTQICLTNPFSMPGGACTTFGCTPGMDSTCASGGDGTCIPLGGSGICLDTCTMATQCRMAEGYTCVDSMPTDTVPGLCLWPHKEPGAPCTMSSDCGAAPWECLMGARFPGGYCGARACTVGDDQTCPFDSKCFDPPGGVNDQYCVATCMDDSKCNVTGGYTCKPLTAMPADGKGCQQ